MSGWDFTIDRKMMSNDQAIYEEENKLYSIFSQRKRQNVREKVLKELYEEREKLELEYKEQEKTFLLKNGLPPREKNNVEDQDKLETKPSINNIDNKPQLLTRKQLIELVNGMKRDKFISDIDISGMTDDEIKNLIMYGEIKSVI